MLEAFLLGSGKNRKNKHRKTQENITLIRSSIFSKREYIPTVHYGIFFMSQYYRQYQKFCMESMMCLFLSCVTL